MKIYQQAAAVCVVFGLLGGVLSFGVEGALQSEPSRKLGTTATVVSVPSARLAGSAINRLYRAAELFNLGQTYYQEEGGSHDDEEAAYYFKKSAELGDARAQIRLGMMYANGRGVQKDFDEAIYWIRQASDLAQLSWHDAAVAEAVSWLQEASGHGYVPAQRTLELMEGSGSYSGAGADKSVFWFRKPAVSGDAGWHSVLRRNLPAGVAGQVHPYTMPVANPALKINVAA